MNNSKIQYVKIKMIKLEVWERLEESIRFESVQMSWICLKELKTALRVKNDLQLGNYKGTNLEEKEV